MEDAYDRALEAVERRRKHREGMRQADADRDDAIRDLYAAGEPPPKIHRTLIAMGCDPDPNPKVGDGISLSNIRRVKDMRGDRG